MPYERENECGQLVYRLLITIDNPESGRYYICMVTDTVETDGTAAATGKLMRQMVERYYRDMLPWHDMSFEDVFECIKNIPFRPDPVQTETLMRPLYTMTGQGWGGDCDDKAIAIASWAKLNNLPFRFISVRRKDRDTLHHVYAEIFFKSWVRADCTYCINSPGAKGLPYVEYRIIG